MRVLTATTRLARELQQQYNREQEAAGLRSWPTAPIVPLTVWLTELWKSWLLSRQAETVDRPFRLAEEQVIWEDIIRSTADNLLLDVPAATELALASWRLLCDWNLSLDATEWEESPDSETFQAWADEFRRRSRRLGGFSQAELPAVVAELIEQGKVAVPEQVEIAGFFEPTPVLRRVFSALGERGTEVRQRTLPDLTANAVRLGLADASREVRAAAEWARDILEDESNVATPDFRIGVIVPGLDQLRGQIERVFGEVLHPRSRLRPDLDPERLFNISLGLPASEYPIIKAAILILETDPQEIAIEIASRIVRSPFLTGATEELTKRALLDVALRSLGEPRVSAADIVRLAGHSDASRRCPRLVSHLRSWSTQFEALQNSRTPSDWAHALSGLLHVIGWPGDRVFDSAEYQTLEVWDTLLSDLAGLDGIFENIPLNVAVGLLGRIASTRPFQPKSEPAPVQILGVLEASGLRFDKLWIMGMHDNAWPAATAPDPFLPLRLQRRCNLPRSTPNRELEYAKNITARLLSSAPTVVVSYPQRDGDVSLRASPLFGALPEVSADDLGLLNSASYVEQLQRSSLMERLEDHSGPPCRESALRGGTSIFKLQAACPFKAFAELRLGTRGPDLPEPGLSALDRGQLVHRILEVIWDQLCSHAELQSVASDRLEEIIRLAVGSEIQRFARRRRALRRPKFAKIEQTRLERVIGEWLALERNRQPFTVLEQEKQRQVVVGSIDMNIRVDRVDRLENGALVILDYKTGECSVSSWRGDRPDEPQLPIYAVATDDPLAAFFFGRLKTGKIGFVGLANSADIAPGVRVAKSQPPLAQIVEEWGGALDRLGQDFRAGHALVDPKDRRQTCRYCELPSLCRIGQASIQLERDDA